MYISVFAVDVSLVEGVRFVYISVFAVSVSLVEGVRFVYIIASALLVFLVEGVRFVYISVFALLVSCVKIIKNEAERIAQVQLEISRIKDAKDKLDEEQYSLHTRGSLLKKRKN